STSGPGSPETGSSSDAPTGRATSGDSLGCSDSDITHPCLQLLVDRQVVAHHARRGPALERAPPAGDAIEAIDVGEPRRQLADVATHVAGDAVLDDHGHRAARERE